MNERRTETGGGAIDVDNVSGQPNALAQLALHWKVPAVDVCDPQGQGNCWAIAFAGGLGVHFQHAKQQVYVFNETLAHRSFCKKKKSSLLLAVEVAHIQETRQLVWDLLELSVDNPTRFHFDESDVGVAGRTDALKFQRQLRLMSERGWMRKPAPNRHAEWSGDTAFRALAASRRCFIVCILGTHMWTARPTCTLFDGTDGKWRDETWHLLHVALDHVAKSPAVPLSVVVHRGDHFHYLRPRTADALAAVQQVQAPPPARAARHGSGLQASLHPGTPYPAWYGEDDAADVAVRYLWCAYHDRGTGAYLHAADSFRGVQQSESAASRACVTCGAVRLSRGAQTAAGPTLAQCHAHAPRLSKRRSHVWASTYKYDGPAAAEFMRACLDAEAARHAAAQEPSVRAAAAAKRGRMDLMVVRHRLSSIERNIPEQAMRSGWQKRTRSRWHSDLAKADDASAVAAVVVEFLDALIAVDGDNDMYTGIDDAATAARDACAGADPAEMRSVSELLLAAFGLDAQGQKTKATERTRQRDRALQQMLREARADVRATHITPCLLPSHPFRSCARRRSARRRRGISNGTGSAAQQR